MFRECNACLSTQLVRTRLEDAGQEEKLVESLIPMWDEERQRSEGRLPESPPSPPRTPAPLCRTVDDVRAQFQVRALHFRLAVDIRRRFTRSRERLSTLLARSVSEISLSGFKSTCDACALSSKYGASRTGGQGRSTY